MSKLATLISLPIGIALGYVISRQDDRLATENNLLKLRIADFRGYNATTRKNTIDSVAKTISDKVIKLSTLDPKSVEPYKEVIYKDTHKAILEHLDKKIVDHAADTADGKYTHFRINYSYRGDENALRIRYFYNEPDHRFPMKNFCPELLAIKKEDDVSGSILVGLNEIIEK
nr:hypothetical protein K-LCC10_0457 [Kaumoebavirus]